MVAEKVVWSRQRSIREEMLQLLTRLHSIEKQRRHFSGQDIRFKLECFRYFYTLSFGNKNQKM
jgi:hypothetical protein